MADRTDERDAGHGRLMRRLMGTVLFAALLGGCTGTYDAVCSDGTAEALGLLVVTGTCGAILVAEETTRQAEHTANRAAGVEQARAHHRAWLLRDAGNGDDEAAYRLAVMLTFEGHPDATRWIRHAASNGHRPARMLLASWYNPVQFGTKVTPMHITPDLRFAYAWYTLAMDHDDPNAELFRRRLGKGLTAAELAEADRIINQWRPGLCPVPVQD